MTAARAALLLYGLQIAASNVKQTSFEPYYKKLIRNLPAAEPAQANVSSCYLEQAPTAQTRDESKTCPELVEAHLVLQPAPSLPPAASTGEEPSSSAQPQSSIPPQLATDNCQLATASPPTDHCPPATAPPPSRKRPSRRRRNVSFTLDRQMLSSSPRAALSLMFQREVKRHLARLDFPNSPDPDPAES